MNLLKKLQEASIFKGPPKEDEKFRWRQNPSQYADVEGVRAFVNSGYADTVEIARVAKSLNLKLEWMIAKLTPEEKKDYEFAKNEEMLDGYKVFGPKDVLKKFAKKVEDEGNLGEEYDEIEGGLEVVFI